MCESCARLGLPHPTDVIGDAKVLLDRYEQHEATCAVDDCDYCLDMGMAVKNSGELMRVVNMLGLASAMTVAVEDHPDAPASWRKVWPHLILGAPVGVAVGVNIDSLSWYAPLVAQLIMLLVGFGVLELRQRRYRKHLESLPENVPIISKATVGKEQA